jgi:hypothetical protein
MADLTLNSRLDAYVGTHFLVAQSVAIGAASAASTQLAAGMYRVCANGNCWIQQGTSSVSVTANGTNASYLPAGLVEIVRVDDTTAQGYIAVIRDGTSSGYVSITTCY